MLDPGRDQDLTVVSLTPWARSLSAAAAASFGETAAQLDSLLTSFSGRMGRASAADQLRAEMAELEAELQSKVWTECCHSADGCSAAVMPGRGEGEGGPGAGVRRLDWSSSWHTAQSS